MIRIATCYTFQYLIAYLLLVVLKKIFPREDALSKYTNIVKRSYRYLQIYAGNEFIKKKGGHKRRTHSVLIYTLHSSLLIVFFLISMIEKRCAALTIKLRYPHDSTALVTVASFSFFLLTTIKIKVS